MNGIIYKATSPSGKIYIGQTTKSLSYRKSQHYRDIESKPCYFHSALKKYKKDDILWSILDIFDSKNNADYLEKKYIKLYETQNPEKGYNQQSGGYDGKTNSFTIEKIRQASIKQFSNPDNVKKLQDSLRKFYDNGGVSYWKGKKHSEYTKKKQSDAKKRNPTNYWLGKNRKEMNGDNNPNCRFKDEVVYNIINLYNTGEYSLRELGRKFKTSHSSIKYLMQRKSVRS